MKLNQKLIYGFLMNIVVLFLIIDCTPKSLVNYVTVNRITGSTEWSIDSPMLSKGIEILDIREKQEEEVLYVMILLKNGWYRPISGKLKLEYFDEDGIQIENPWGWHPINLESNQEEWFKFMAPRVSGNISEIKIMVRGIGQTEMPVR